VKHEFSKFGVVIDKVSKKLDEAQTVIDDEVGRRRRAMERQLRAVEALPEAEAVALLEYDGEGGRTAADLDQAEARAAAE
jgi:DNA recombination protein RmuC